MVSALSAPPVDRFVYGRAARLWDDATCVILGGGPSLTREDAAYCRTRGARVIAIKDAVRLLPDADVLYACEAKWWRHHDATPEVCAFSGPRFALEMAAAPWASVLKNTGDTGLEMAADGLKTGRNSGYQAINLAVHLGARRIVLLGFDMCLGARGEAHWFGPHPYHFALPFELFHRCFPTIVAPLRALGITVLNASRRTQLTAFPVCSLEEALA